MLWAAFLNPTKKASPAESVREFEIDMGRLAGDVPATTARRPDHAARRLRERRRRFFTLLVSAWGLTLIVGIAPPLRRLWLVSGLLMLALAAYVWMLLSERPAGAGVAYAREVPARPRVPFPDVSLDEQHDEIVVRRTPRAGSGGF